MSDLITTGRYRIAGPMDTLTAFHVARKLAPALPTIELARLPANAAKDRSVLLLMLFSQLADADAAFVTQKCLAQVRVVQETGLAAMLARDGTLMFGDVTVEEVMALTMEVIDLSLGDFFNTALGALQPGATPAQT